MTFEQPLLSLAVILFAGIVGGELVARIKLPKVTGWIGTGIALRALELPGLDAASLPRFAPFTSFVLGYIAFTVGAALHLASLRNSGKRLSLLLLGEALITPTLVAVALLFIGGLDPRAAILLAAIAIAGAPGTTVLVIQEARARGILTRTLVAAVALIDMVAVGAYTFGTSFMHGGDGGLDSWQAALSSLGVEFGISALIGAGIAAFALLLTRTVVGPAFVGPVMIAMILAAFGTAKTLGVSAILACTFAGIATSNLRHETVRSTEAYLHSIGGVLFAGFYTLAGMRLDFGLVVPLFGLVALFFVARLAGKSLSAFTAMSLAGVPDRVRRYLGIALLPHGGVAVGLIFLVQSDPRFDGISDTVAAVGLAALAINQLLGPSATRFSLVRAGEDHKDRPRLLDFLSEQRIVVGLDGASKREVIETLADRLFSTSTLPIAKEDFVEMVLEREDDASTCLGRGLMIPHAVLEDGAQMHGVLGISSKGMELGARDGREIHAVVLLATPKTDHARHLEVLSAFATAITKDGNLREQLYHARSAAHAYDILHAEDAEELNYFLDEALELAGVKEDA